MWGQSTQQRSLQRIRLPHRRLCSKTLLPINPSAAFQQLLNFIDDFFVLVATGPHLLPKLHEVLGGDCAVAGCVHASEHLLHAEVMKWSLEEGLRSLWSYDHALACGDSYEELLALLPRRSRQFAQEGPLWEDTRAWLPSVTAVLPVDPGRACHELIDLIQYVLLLVASRTNLHPKRCELLCSDCTTPVCIHLVEHGVGTDL
mmetsp:Transcript_11461/g.26519  ORF Transcript_11461/g.26519 Transcript_11461/m.26519 type:complete len:202 (-) Transcript_11461:327-932(-)